MFSVQILLLIHLKLDILEQRAKNATFIASIARIYA